jgi:hypothetical protein
MIKNTQFSINFANCVSFFFFFFEANFHHLANLLQKYFLKQKIHGFEVFFFGYFSKQMK